MRVGLEVLLGIAPHPLRDGIEDIPSLWIVEAIRDHQDIPLRKNLCSGDPSGTTQHRDQPLEILHSNGSGFASIPERAQLAVKLGIVYDKEMPAIGKAPLAGWAVPDGRGQPRIAGGMLRIRIRIRMRTTQWTQAAELSAPPTCQFLSNHLLSVGHQISKRTSHAHGKCASPQAHGTTMSCFDGACPVITNHLTMKQQPASSSSSTNHPSPATAFPCAKLRALPQPPGPRHCLFLAFLGFGHLSRTTGRPHIINRHMFTRPCSKQQQPGLCPSPSTARPGATRGRADCHKRNCES